MTFRGEAAHLFERRLLIISRTIRTTENTVRLLNSNRHVHRRRHSIDTI